MFRGLMVTQFQRPAQAQAGKKEVFSDHRDQPCMPLASSCGHYRAAQDGRLKAGPKGAWSAGKSLPLVSFRSECCSNNYFPCVKQHLLPHGVQDYFPCVKHLLPHGVQDVQPDFVYQGITAALSQGKQAVPAGSTSEQHRASSAKT